MYMLKLLIPQYKLYTCVDWCNFKKQQHLQHDVNEGTSSQERSHTDDRSPYVNSSANQEFNLDDYKVPMEYEDVDKLGSNRPTGDYQELNPMTIGLPKVYSTVNTSPNNKVLSGDVYEEIH